MTKDRQLNCIKRDIINRLELFRILALQVVADSYLNIAEIIDVSLTARLDQNCARLIKNNRRTCKSDSCF